VVRQILVGLGILNQVMQNAVIIKDSYSDLIARKADLGIWALPCSHVVLFIDAPPGGAESRTTHVLANPDNSCACDKADAST
jgi:hypothetical protein